MKLAYAETEKVCGYPRFCTICRPLKNVTPLPSGRVSSNSGRLYESGVHAKCVSLHLQHCVGISDTIGIGVSILWTPQQKQKGSIVAVYLCEMLKLAPNGANFQASKLSSAYMNLPLMSLLTMRGCSLTLFSRTIAP